MDKKGRILVICATILVLIFLGTASATNRSVDGSGGADFSGIQEAINNASMGDTILVHSCVYCENVYVNKSVTLKGIGYPVVDANGSGSAITLNADGITLEGFNATNSGSSGSDVGIKVTSNNNTITGNNVSNNRGGICLSSSSNNKIYFNNFINNTYSVKSRGSTNIWNSPLEITYTYDGTTYKSYLGNYWSDYGGTDAEGDGIGDTHYSIDSKSDDYPLIMPFENYISSEFETGVAATSNMETIAKTFVTLLNGSEFEKAHGLFNKDMAEALPVDKLNATWNGLIDQYGAFTGIENISSAEEKGYECVFVTCNFSKTFLDAKIVFDIHEKIAGLFFRPIYLYPPPEYADHDSFTEIECTVGTGNWKLPGTLTIPKGEGPFHAVVLVAGSGPEDRDETIGPNKPFKDLAWGLATEGIAVLRYEKRTYRYPEECIAMVKNDNFTVNDETIDDAIAAVDLLRETERIDPDNISVLGHSWGGYLAPRIAARDENISRLILLAAPARSLPDLIIEQTEYLASLDGKIDDKETKSLEEVKEQAKKVKELNISRDERLLVAPKSYWADLSDYDPVKTARNLSPPILILQGERDYHVTMVDYEMWINGLTGKNNVRFTPYADFNHLFMAVPGTGKATPADLFIPGHVALIVIDNVADWILNKKINY